jgi:hypothetical protein
MLFRRSRALAKKVDQFVQMLPHSSNNLLARDSFKEEARSLSGHSSTLSSIQNSREQTILRKNPFSNLYDAGGSALCDKITFWECGCEMRIANIYK